MVVRVGCLLEQTAYVCGLGMVRAFHQHSGQFHGHLLGV